MAKLTLERRDKLAGSQFGLPGQKKYPMPDRAHAANAKARATQQVGKSITPAQKAEIDAKANRVFGKDPDAANRYDEKKAKKIDPKAKGPVYRSEDDGDGI